MGLSLFIDIFYKFEGNYKNMLLWNSLFINDSQQYCNFPSVNRLALFQVLVLDPTPLKLKCQCVTGRE